MALIFDNFLFGYNLGILSILAGEVLVFYLPIHFFYYLANLIIFTRSSRIACIFFLEGAFKGIYLREKNFTLSYIWFQRYEFLKDPPLHFMGEALGILYNQTFFCSDLEHLFIR